MAYWVVRLEPQRERLALHFLQAAGFVPYYPCLREWRVVRGRRVEHRPALFPSYAFLCAAAQWHAVRWSAGVAALLMDGERPARVADEIVDDIRRRERGGLIE